MRLASLFSLACSLPFVVKAAPVLQSRQSATATDTLVLQFAEVLNQLESQFYQQANAKFNDSDFASAGFHVTDIPERIFAEIQVDEQTHLTFLDGALGNNTVSGCKFDFTGPLDNVKDMVTFARTLEQVGVSAFLGAAELVSDRSILTAAATILTVEARHQTLLNTLNGGSAIPQAFDQPLTPQQILAVAGPIISGCNLGIPPNLPVNITNAVLPGNKLEFNLTGIQGDQLFCQMILAGQPIALSQPIDNCIVPSSGLPDGPVYIFISNDTQPLATNIVLQNAGQIVAGPAIAFIDQLAEQAPDALGTLVRETGDQNGSNSDLEVIGLTMQPV